MVHEKPSTVVRTARAADADAVGRVHVQSWQAAYADVLPADLLRDLSIADRQKGWHKLLTTPNRTGEVLVVVDDGAVAGFACVGGSRDGDAPTGTGELQSIYLAPEKWGRELGRQLHEEAIATLRRVGYTRATLWVLESNTRARHFYERAGWTPDSARKVDRVAGSPPVAEVRYARAL